jgi:hypothetical protein
MTSSTRIHLPLSYTPTTLLLISRSNPFELMGREWVISMSLAIHRSSRVEGRYPQRGAADSSFDEVEHVLVCLLECKIDGKRRENCELYTPETHAYEARAHETHTREICAHEIHELGRCGGNFSPHRRRSCHYFQVKSSVKSVTEPWGATIINGGQNSGHCPRRLPSPFWRVSVAALRLCPLQY